MSGSSHSIGFCARAYRAARRLGRARDGATAVEFAALAFPFMLMLFAVLEVSYMFLISTSLEAATNEAARRIRTGEMQMAGASGQDFLDAVCAEVSVVVPCDDAAYVDVRVFDDFDDVSHTNPVSGGEFDPSGLQADFGEAGDIVVARVYYVWRVFTPGLGAGLANLSGGRRLLVSASTFRNEPFGEIEGGGS